MYTETDDVSRGVSVRLMQADVPNANGRVYSAALLAKVAVEAQIKAKDGKLLVHLPRSQGVGHPEDLQDVCGTVKRVEFNAGNNQLMVEIEFIPEKLAQAKGALAFHAGGEGKLDADGSITDYSLNCVYAVAAHGP